MYQSIYFDYSTRTIFLRDDKLGWDSFKHQPTFYKRVSKSSEDSLPILTGGYGNPTTRWVKDDPSLLERDLDPCLYTLRELYYKEDDSIPSYHNITYIDIETEMGGAITPEFIQSTPQPLTSLSLLDKTTKTKICFIIDKSGEIKEVTEGNKHIIPVSSERELFSKFLDKWEELDPTIVCGWNSEYFDIPYLYFRMCNTIGREQASRLSPIRKINVQDWNPKQIIVRIGGINHLDYMLLFKKYIAKQEPSYKLGVIGEKYVELGKIEYEGNLNQLFKRDLETFIEYNLRDVEIVEALEEKLKFIELTILISHICNTPYEQIYYNTVLGEGAILKYLKREGIISPNKPTTHNPLRKGREETYAGGYILEPTPGLYYDCIDLDFTSLYPSIIKSLNLGIETLVGRIVVNNNYEQNHSLDKLKERDPNEVVTIERLDKEEYSLQSSEVKLGKLIKIIKDNHYTISSSGAMFRTDEQSVVSRILEAWFEKREHYRSLKKKAGKEKDWSKYKLYDGFQQAFKILQNGTYGTFAKNTWRYTDGHMICSSAITNTGQVLTKSSIELINTKLNKENKTNKNYIIISDTDSLVMELKDIINKESVNIDKDILKIANNIQVEANHYLNELCSHKFNINDKHYFQLKQEIIASCILVTGKRRYGMHVVNKEGVEVDEIVLMGLEVMKSNMNPLFKKFGTQLLKFILSSHTKLEIDNYILEFNNSVKDIEPKLLGKPTGVSFINKCIKRQAGSGEIFSELNINTKENSRAAIIYNDLLRFKGLDKKYESIIEGDKIFIVNLKPNPYKLNVIGFPNSILPPEIDKFINTYIDREAIWNSSLQNKLEDLYSDLSWELPNMNPNISKFFSFS